MSEQLKTWTEALRAMWRALPGRAQRKEDKDGPTRTSEERTETMRREIKLVYESHTGDRLYEIEIEYENGEQEKYFFDEHPEGLYITEAEPNGCASTVFVPHEALALITAVAERAKKRKTGQ